MQSAVGHFARGLGAFSPAPSSVATGLHPQNGHGFKVSAIACASLFRIFRYSVVQQRAPCQPSVHGELLPERGMKAPSIEEDQQCRSKWNPSPYSTFSSAQ